MRTPQPLQLLGSILDAKRLRRSVDAAAVGKMGPDLDDLDRVTRFGSGARPRKTVEAQHMIKTKSSRNDLRSLVHDTRNACLLACDCLCFRISTLLVHQMERIEGIMVSVQPRSLTGCMFSFAVNSTLTFLDLRLSILKYERGGAGKLTLKSQRCSSMRTHAAGGRPTFELVRSYHPSLQLF
eukprot:GHVU01082713.1.p1 GENE.GHVU01082713.1~~GHVU01082713.1.p1  ORF type:complete len:182 (+),score=5.97 GHVU01082713.1:213-758(+)